MNKFLDIVKGPVIPLPTPFTKEGAVDHESLGRYVRFLVNNGIRNVMTTVGTSRFNLLAEEEIMRVNETVVKAAEGKAVTIVANPTIGGTAKTIDFARHSKKIGADLFLVYYPERYYGEDNTYTFFKSINDAVDIGVLIHEMPARNGFGPGTVQYSLDLLNRLLDLKNIVGVKEEALDTEYSNKVVSSIKDKAVVIGAGGGMSRYLFRDFKLGSKAFLGGIGNFQPELELLFYNCIVNGNVAEAERIVKKIEQPYFEKVVPMGWHPSLKAALALKGLLPPFERSPMKQIDGQELVDLRNMMLSNGWL